MAASRLITSSANPLIQTLRRAIRRGEATQDGFLVAGTPHLLAEAVRSGVPVGAVAAAAGAADKARSLLAGSPSTRLALVEDRLFQRIADTETTQGIIALVRAPQWRLEDLLTGVPLVVILDGLQDPGNAGTIVRSAEAFGATGVVFLHGSVSPHNPKTVRAAAGSLFRVPFTWSADASEVRPALSRCGLRLYCTMPGAANPLDQAGLAAASALVIGSEARGVSGTLWPNAEPLTIPTSGVESLNAAVAASVVLYEAARQRARKAPAAAAKAHSHEPV